VTDLNAILEPLSSVAVQAESELGDAVAKRLSDMGVAFEREVWLNDTDRIDFMVGRVGVELKLKGPVSAVARQLARYAQSERVDSLVLVTTRFKHKAVPKQLCRKPIAVVCVGNWL
jgi:hypothetical protein